MVAKVVYPHEGVKSRYVVQEVRGNNTSAVNFRITDSANDDRISTSYDFYHAQLVCDSLNERDARVLGAKNTLDEIQTEIDRAKAKHGPQKLNSFHEGYAVLLEEVDELKAEVWKSKHNCELMRKEAIQVAAMAVRFIDELT